MEASDRGYSSDGAAPVGVSCLDPGIHSWPADAISSVFTAPQVHDTTATIVENGGTDVDAASTIELLTRINMGSKLGGSHLFLTVLLTDSSHLDLVTVNQVFELTFDPAGFRGRIFLLLSTTPNPCPNPPKNSLYDSQPSAM